MSGTEVQVIDPVRIPGTFTPGDSDSRRWKGGRRSRLENAEFVELFGMALADGLTVPQLAEVFEIGERTAVEYKKDPRVQVAANKRIKDRVLEITRKVDSTIAARLEQAKKMDTETLLKIRKEYLGGAFREMAEGKDNPDVVNEAVAAIEKNPDLAAAFADLLKADDEPVTADRE